MSQQWTLVTQSHIQINEMEVHDKKDKDHVALCNENISSQKKHVEKLQLKIEEEIQNKIEIKTSRITSIEKKLVQEANIGI